MGRWDGARPIERFLDKIEVDRDTGCVVWVGALGTHGYGNFYVGGRYLRAHRFAYEYFVGEIPDGLTLDHLCRNRACVSPMHLEAVTLKVNNERGSKATQTHCVNGHQFTTENTIIRSNGTRRCKACQYARANAYNRERRRKAVAS